MLSPLEEQVQTLEGTGLEARFPMGTGRCAERRQAEKCLRKAEGANVHGSGCTRHQAL